MESEMVTVMIPSYNYARFLPDAVESAASQVNADVVVVDNGSTDESPAVGRDLAERFDNVRFVSHADNLGIITSFNRCRDEIRGEYTVLLCADDVLSPGSLARSLSFMTAHPSVGLAYGPVRYFSSFESIAPEAVPPASVAPVVHRGAEWIARLCRTGANPISTPEAIMRSSVLAAAGPYEERTPYTSDLNLWLRMAALADVAFLPGPIQAYFRLHDSNEGNAYPHASAAEVSQRWTAYATFFETLGDDPRRSGWERSARRRLANTARYAASRAYVRTDLDETDHLLRLASEIDADQPAGERIGWALRRRLGPRVSRVFPPFAPRPVAHRVERVVGERRQRRSGIA
jgi:glycosyltransferase involved in cell wall biosynthesis